ncbi:recombinase family protein [Pimelobacter simplex]|uniref:recombinase family protein n=1 Tax=Nocardioides simplex TaxID=2045 RepID=UPI0019325146|nr:recombinase family protein [Pimelobacter simplex]
MAYQLHVPQAPAIYARISLDRTGQALGVQRQIEECRERCRSIGWPEPKIYSDNDVSARSGKRRPSFEQLLLDVEAGYVDGILAWHLDRVLRRVVDLERVLDAIESQKSAVPVVFLQAGEIDLMTPSGRLLARILAAVAANEGDVKSARLSAQRAQAAQSGQAHGPLGYGYDEDQRIIPEEAEVVREVAQRVLDGETLYSIAADLNDRGVSTPGSGRWDSRRVERAVERRDRLEVVEVVETARGDAAVKAAVFARLLRRAGGTPALCTASWVRDQPWAEHLMSGDHGVDDSTVARLLGAAGIPADRSFWRAANVRAMVRRGSLCGWREFSPGKRGGYGDLVSPGDWTPILSKEVTENIRRITDRPSTRRGRDPKYLLAAILKCGKCGSSMAGSPTNNGGYRYACSKQPGRPHTCGGLTIAGPQTDAIVSMAVIDVVAEAKVRSGAIRRRSGAAAAAAESEIAEIAHLRKHYGSEFAAGRLHRDEWEVLREGWAIRQRDAERQLGQWAPSLETVLSDVPRKRADIEEWWTTAPMRQRREIVRTLIESIEIAPRGKSNNRFDDSRIGEPVWRA